MQSTFAGPARPNAPIANPAVDESYTLQGLNLRDPDAIITNGETSFTINSREYARNDGEQRVANRMRQGAAVLSTPVGETLDTQQVGSVTDDTLVNNLMGFSTTVPVAVPWTATGSGALTRLDIELTKASFATPTGHIIVEIYTDNSGKPGTLIAESSYLASTVSASPTYTYLTAHFIDAPSLTAGHQYWFMCYIQDNGSGIYLLHQTVAAGGALNVTFTGNKTTGMTITGTSAIGKTCRFKTYLSTAGGVQGHSLRYPSNNANLILFAQLGVVYSVSLSAPTPTVIDSTLSSSAKNIRFTQVDDMTVYVDGTNPARFWDGTNPAANLAGVPSAAPLNVLTWKNYLFFQTGPTRIDFSDINNFTSYPAVNFFYVGTPLSADHITGWEVFHDALTVFTHNTKYLVLAGASANISTFTYKEAVGTKGAVSQEAICADANFIYFISDDGNLYAWNGAKDVLLSDKLQPELSAITDKTKIRLGFYRNQLRLYYPKAPSTFANQMLLYDLELQQWFMDTGHPVNSSDDLYLDSQQLVEFSSLVGAVYLGESGFDDLGKAIAWKYHTNYKTYAYRRRNGQTFGGGSAKKRIKRFHPVVRTEDVNYTMYVGKDMDFANTPDMREYIISGGGATWGSFVWGDGTRYGQAGQISKLSGMSGRGLHIQYRFERTGVETPAELYGYIAQYKLGRQK